MTKVTNPVTGEIVEVEKPADAKQIWQDANEFAKRASKAKDELKPLLKKWVEDNSGNPIEFSDGYRFVQVDSQQFVIDPNDFLTTLAKSDKPDESGIPEWVRAIELLLRAVKPDCIDLRRLDDMRENGEITKDELATLKDKKLPYRAKSYIKLERV